MIFCFPVVYLILFAKEITFASFWSQITFKLALLYSSEIKYFVINRYSSFSRYSASEICENLYPFKSKHFENVSSRKFARILNIFWNVAVCTFLLTKLLSELFFFKYKWSPFVQINFYSLKKFAINKKNLYKEVIFQAAVIGKFHFNYFGNISTPT